MTELLSDNLDISRFFFLKGEEGCLENAGIPELEFYAYADRIWFEMGASYGVN